jgi:ABC-type multidrug transport system ATPase subunit/pSer/pThr/pTyr-binding forkhead associated (FHA) protein
LIPAVQTYPALLDLATQTLHALGLSESFLVGRNETADLCVSDPTCSRHHFRLVRQQGRYHVEPLNPRNPTYLNNRSLLKPEPVDHGALLQAGDTRFQFLLKAVGGGKAQVAPQAPPPFAATRTIVRGPSEKEDASLDCTDFPLVGVMAIGRDRDRVQIHLPHPQVSRLHARIALQGATATLTDLSSANGTFVNGQRIQNAATLRAGDQVDIGPYALRFTGTTLTSLSRADNVQLVARGVRRVVTDRETARPLVLLDDVTLVIRPKEFVCLLGPSGSGKSTLLTALSGRSHVEGGRVLLNGRDLFANFEAMKQDIAVVPQKDILHDSLTVGQALWYTARLRLPPDTSPAEIELAISQMLETVKLTERRTMAIRLLSGGQLKRASLANEILCGPSLLFLDEVTSGLDEQTDREMMNLFRSLADAGKTVVCITHSLANVDRTCHLVVILTAGGKLAFVGKPAEALTYFGIERLGDVYQRLAEKPAEHWRETFRKSQLCQRYVGARIPPDTGQSPTVEAAPLTHPAERFRVLLRQTRLVTSRYAAIWRGNYAALLAMAGQAIAVAGLLGLLFGDLDAEASLVRANRSVNLLFVVAISSFWFGCNNAAKEVVKERTIFRRERDFNLRNESYYASKVMLLTAFSWLQTLLLFSIVGAWCRPPLLFKAESVVVLLTLALTGVTLGLAISTLAATEEMAITLIPLAVIPQIILSDVIAPLGGWSKGLALLAISTYWGNRGLDACLEPKVAGDAGLESHSIWVAVMVLLVHAAVCVAASLIVLHRENQRRTLRSPGDDPKLTTS